MKYSLRLALVAILLYCGSACSTEPRLLSESEREAVETAAHREFAGLVAAVKGLDTERYFTYFDRAAFTSLNPDGTVTRSFDEFERMFRSQAAAVDRYETLEFPTIKVTVLDRAAALLVNEYRAIVVLKSGERVAAAGAGAQLWSRTGTQWKLVHVSSSVAPPVLQSDRIE